ncbi:MAG: glycosyltransferase family 39 protein [Candidatus Poribacteria bacterium]|nr:glycosyltransferase family 39 protein [Candidatus Poribacteria bacterium]
MRVPLAVRNCFRLPDSFVIAAILIIGFSFRLIGVNVGLPDSPDPREVLIAQDVLNLIHFTAPPQIYNWPGTAWFYIIAGVGKLLSFCGWHPTETGVILLARCINVLLSTATLWFTYRIGFHCYSKRVGQLAAGLLAVAMLHATNESRFALVDIPATFCVALFFWCLTRARSASTTLTFQTAISLGVIVGVGFAVKFTTVFVVFALLCFISSRHFYRRLATIVGISALTFTFLCPYWLIDLISPEWNLFFADFWYEASHYHWGHFGLITTAESDWLSRFIYLWTLLKWGMGLPLALLSSLGVLYALVLLKAGSSQQGAEKREKGKDRDPNLPTFQPSNQESSSLPPFQSILLLSFVVPYLLFIGIHKVKFVRHLLILYPILTVLAATALRHFPNIIEMLSEAIGSRKDGNLQYPTVVNTFGKWFHVILGGVVVLYSFVYTVSFASVLLTQPTRIEVSNWVAAHIPPEESIATAPEILFDWLLPELELVTDEGAKWVLILVPDLEVFQKYGEHPQSYQDRDWYPLSVIDLEGTLEFYTRVLGEGSPYKLQKTFRRRPEFFGIQISDSGAPFPMRALAHPELRVYRHLDEIVP